MFLFVLVRFGSVLSDAVADLHHAGVSLAKLATMHDRKALDARARNWEKYIEPADPDRPPHAPELGSQQMSGSAGGGGYDYQAELIALVASYGIAEHPLGWFDNPSDVPTAVLAETKGPGDDIAIELASGARIEAQAKKGLRADHRLWDALTHLARGVTKDETLRGVLLVDSNSSKTIRYHLREDFCRLADGRTDQLRKVTKRALLILGYDAERTQGLFARLKIVVTDVAPDSDGRAAAQNLLRQVLQNPKQCVDVWTKLADEGHDLIGRRGRISMQAMLEKLGKSTEFSPSAKSLLASRTQYCKWVEQATSTFLVPGLGISLGIQQAWIRLRILEDDTERRPSRVSLSTRLENYHEWARLAEYDSHRQDFDAEHLVEYRQRTVVVGGPGSGKSTLIRRMANQLARKGRLVMMVRLPEVSRRVSSGELFQEALVRVAADGSGFNNERALSVLSTPDVLLADGLDECDPDRASIARRLRAWAEGHPSCHVCVVTRPVGHAPGLLPGFSHVELLPLSREAIEEHARRLFAEAVDSDSRADRLCTKFLDVVEGRSRDKSARTLAARNPLLLGFLVRLSIDGIPIDGNRSYLYGHVFDLMYSEKASDRAGVANVGREVAMTAVESAGWSLLKSRERSADRVEELAAEALMTYVGATPESAPSQAREAIDLWEEHGLLERISAGHLSGLVFIHPSLGEFAAARHSQRLPDNEFRVWVQTVCRSSQWRQVLLLSAGIGRHKSMVDELLQANLRDYPSATEVTLAAAIVAESGGEDSALSKKVTLALRSQLESDIPLVCIEAAQAICPLAPLIPDVVESIALPLLGSSSEWQRLSATAMLLAAESEQLTNDHLRQWYRNLSPVQVLIPRIHGPDSSQHLPNEASDLQHEIVRLAARRLAATESGQEVSDFFGGLNLRESFSYAMLQAIAEELSEAGLKKAALLVYQRGALLEPALHENIEANAKIHRLSERILLECIIEATEANPEGGPSLSDPPFLGLSAVFEALDIGGAPAYEIAYLKHRIELPAVVTVLRGTAAALGLDMATLAAEAHRAIEGMSDEGASIYTFIASVPASPSWERAKTVRLDEAELGAGVRHPFSPIRWGAANLIDAGAAGNRTGEILFDALENGEGGALFFVAQLIPRYCKEDGIERLLKRTEGKLTSGCEHLLAAVLEVAEGPTRKRAIRALFSGLEQEKAELAAKMAELLGEIDPPLGPDCVKPLREVYDLWTERGTWCERHQLKVEGGGCPECHVVPPSPSGNVVRELARLEHWSFDELWDLYRDSRYDVSGAARDALIKIAATDQCKLLAMLRRIGREGGPIALLRGLFAIPRKALEEATTAIVKLLGEGSPGVRACIVAQLPGGWLRPSEALRVAGEAMTDPDPAVRTQATRAVRLLSASLDEMKQ